eukprot:m.35200 g.35200  ORF g.35200 m.35200 type:complete len:141 (+) comp8855_c0_seq1:105-527(+)
MVYTQNTFILSTLVIFSLVLQDPCVGNKVQHQGHTHKLSEWHEWGHKKSSFFTNKTENEFNTGYESGSGLSFSNNDYKRLRIILAVGLTGCFSVVFLWLLYMFRRRKLELELENNLDEGDCIEPILTKNEKPPHMRTTDV